MVILKMNLTLHFPYLHIDYLKIKALSELGQEIIHRPNSHKLLSHNQYAFQQLFQQH